MKQKKYNLEQIQDLKWNDIFKPPFITDGVYIYADAADGNCNITAFDVVDDGDFTMNYDEVEQVLKAICDILNGKRGDISYKVKSVIDEVINFENGMSLRVRGWGYLTSTYVDYENCDREEIEDIGRYLAYEIQNRFAAETAFKIDPEYHKKCVLNVHEKILRNSVWGSYTGELLNQHVNLTKFIEGISSLLDSNETKDIKED